MNRPSVAFLLVISILTAVLLYVSPRQYTTAAGTESTTSLASVSSTGEQGNFNSGVPSISADGRFVAFDSFASNLVPGDTNDHGDVFIHDRQEEATTRVSVSSSGVQGNGTSVYPTISGDGRFVAFISYATNLVPGDTNGQGDLFVHDRQTGATTRVSVASSGAQANQSSLWHHLSFDGRFVTFETHASNLVSGDTNADDDIFVHDRLTATTTRVSVTTSGAQANNQSGSPSVSADGRLVAFGSHASNLVAGDTNAYYDVFVHDRQTGATTRVSVSSTGVQGNSASILPAISADGRFVTFTSSAPNFVTGDTNNRGDIFVHDRHTGEITRVSVSSSGAQADGSSQSSSVSADGRYVVFESSASNLVPGDMNSIDDVFVHDRETELTTRVSVSSSGGQSNGWVSWPYISGDGCTTVFESSASNLVANDTNNSIDVFVHHRGNACGDPSPDFEISHIEVTQAIQSLDNSVDLIAGKTTYARVHVRNEGAPSTSWVTAELCWNDDCRSPNNQVAGHPQGYIQIPVDPDRGELDQSFYFLLDETWVDEPGELVLTAVVNGRLDIYETDYSNNTFTTTTKDTPTIVPSYPLYIKLFNVDYALSSIPGLRDRYRVTDNRPDFDYIRSWLTRAYPVAAEDIHISRDDLVVHFPPLDPLDSYFLNTLRLRYATALRYVIDYMGRNQPADPTYYYSVATDADYSDVPPQAGVFIEGESSGPAGTGPTGTPGTLVGTRLAGFLWDRDGVYGDWYAGHELGHMLIALEDDHVFSTILGCDTDITDINMGYEYPDGRIGGPVDDLDRFYGFDVNYPLSDDDPYKYPLRVYPPTWHDMMTYCPNLWISDYSYSLIYQTLSNNATRAGQPASSSANPREEETEYLLISAVINLTQNTADFEASYRLSSHASFVPAPSGQFAIVLLGEGDVPLATYPVTVNPGSDTAPNEDKYGLMIEAVPWLDGTRKVALKRGSATLATQIVSSHAPSVTVEAPAGGEVITDTLSVNWTAADADDDVLTYILQYSRDGGQIWDTLSIGITGGNSIELDASQLPGGDNVTVRVLASDGVNTTIARSEGPFRVAQKLPVAEITSPAVGAVFTVDQAIGLFGAAYDVEDGYLNGNALTWRSDISGQLGSGLSIYPNILEPGTHRITLTATDIDGNTNAATITLTVVQADDSSRSWLYLPLTIEK